MALARRRSFAHDAAIATAILVGAYVLAGQAPFQALQIPGYLLVVGFDALEAVVGSAGDIYPAAFAAYLATLGLGSAAVARSLRERSAAADRSAWRLGAAGALGVLGTLSILFAGALLVGTAQAAPPLVAAAAGLVLLGAAAWFAGILEVGVNW